MHAHPDLPHTLQLQPYDVQASSIHFPSSASFSSVLGWRNHSIRSSCHVRASHRQRAVLGVEREVCHVRGLRSKVFCTCSRLHMHILTDSRLLLEIRSPKHRATRVEGSLKSKCVPLQVLAVAAGRSMCRRVSSPSHLHAI